MINIVVYSSNKAFMIKNNECLDLIMSNFDFDYNINNFSSYNKKLDTIMKDNNRKIYVLDVVSDNVSGIELALRVRKYDYESVIILVSRNCKCCEDISSNRLMILDFICNDNNYFKRLIDDIHIAISIIYNNCVLEDENKNRLFTFKYKRDVYRISLDDITYIEKESNIKRCIIHTIKDNYYITDSLCSILNQLDNNFFRTHQSCIINLNNIKEMRLGCNMIIFNNGDMTDMITCKTKKEIKKYIGVS